MLLHVAFDMRANVDQIVVSGPAVLEDTAQLSKSATFRNDGTLAYVG